jgi:Amt family ammonium transporter
MIRSCQDCKLITFFIENGLSIQRSWFVIPPHHLKILHVCILTFQVFYAFSATLICWVIWAYKMGFGEQWGKFPLVGAPGPVLTMQQNLAQTELPAAGLSTNFNLSTMIYFQFVFAAITVIILGGSLLGRINILAWMVFVPLWITLSYTVGAFR